MLRTTTNPTLAARRTKKQVPFGKLRTGFRQRYAQNDCKNGEVYLVFNRQGLHQRSFVPAAKAAASFSNCESQCLGW
jgi:hypothetical protein